MTEHIKQNFAFMSEKTLPIVKSRTDLIIEHTAVLVSKHIV
jgi:hypothetical protein